MPIATVVSASIVFWIIHFTAGSLGIIALSPFREFTFDFYILTQTSHPTQGIEVFMVFNGIISFLIGAICGVEVLSEVSSI